LQARMIAALQPTEKTRILEIGTGSGYTAAVMSRLSPRIVSIERYRRLAEGARTAFEQLAIRNIVVRHGDATAPDAAEGTFDRVISWVAFETLPRHLIDVVSSQGMMIAPIGASETVQRIARLQKVGSRFEREDIGEARFNVISGGLPAIL
jgi:protein-L-isoaspartate(D-aspartate) O-methyltransferase